MKVLVIGGSGREHAIVWKLSQSPRVDKIFCAPGNAGIAEFAECIDIKVDDIDSLLNFAKYEWIDLTVVGTEVSLTKGVVEAFVKEERRIFGPDTSGTLLGRSRVFAKEFMTKYGIPTAEYKVFTSYLHAEEYIRLKGTPIVIKADGLVAGKGVVAKTMDDAINALKMIMKEKVFGEAGNKVIIERYLKGEEASFMVLIDGKIAVPLTSSKEDDRIFDNDKGSSKGGMGAYSPAPVVTKKIQTEIMHSIIHPLMKGFARERITYRGVLYTRLMICDGRPYVLDFNCCFGDPEAQPVLVRLKSDLFNALKVTAEGKLRNTVLSWRDDASVCVMLLSKEYPNSYEKGKVIRGLEALRGKDDVVVFHAGTDVNDKGELVTSGEKVLGVTALGKDIRAAKKNAYKAIEKIHFEGMHY